MLRLAVSRLGPAAHLPGTFVLPTLTLPTRILSRGQINSFEAGLETAVLIVCTFFKPSVVIYMSRVWANLKKKRKEQHSGRAASSSQPGGAWDVPLRRAEGWQ